MREPAGARDVEIRPESAPEEFAAVHRTVLAALMAYNREQAGDSAQAPLVLSVRAPDGHVVGGLVAATAWGWLYVDLLWVDAAYRGLGLGRDLLRAAEAEARHRGCVGAFVDTFDFQAPWLYEREGYTRCGVLEGFPPGHRRIYLRKALSAAAVAEPVEPVEPAAAAGQVPSGVPRRVRAGPGAPAT